MNHIKYTTADNLFVECYFFRAQQKSTQQREKKHSAKRLLCRVFFLTGKKASLLNVFFRHSTKIFFTKCPKLLCKENFKLNFEALIKFKSKSFQLQSCITSKIYNLYFGHFFI